MAGVPRYVRWRAGGWRGSLAADAGIAPAACLAAAKGAEGEVRLSRHARTVRLAGPDGALYVKSYAAPGGWRAARAFRMACALGRAGFGAPVVVVAGRRRGEGLLVTREVPGDDLPAAIAGQPSVQAKRRLLRTLGAEIGRLHRAGFVHGDLVPPNVHVGAGGLVFLDNDRTRRSRLLVRLVGRRNLVQLGRFVVPGVTLSDRARVLAAYAAVLGLSPAARRRLAWWVVERTTRRRCAIDRVPPAAARRAGYRQLMRSGGPFDSAATSRGARV